MSFKLSICIPTYNRFKNLKKQLNFLEKENVFTNSDIQVIISNNNSNDKTRECLEEFQSKYSNIIVNHNQENIGVINNFHKVISLSLGEYIWIVGDDDILYTGIVSRVIQVLTCNKSVHHIFINHSITKEGKKINQRVYDGESGLRLSSNSLFFEFNKKLNFGCLMFVTANIYKRQDVLLVNRILERSNELDNFAMPLAYSLYCSNFGTYVISDVYIDNEWGNTSWSEYTIRVFCRDMIAAVDLISKNLNIQKQINPILKMFIPMKYPEVLYGIYSHKYKKNNYAFMWMKENYIQEILLDYLKGIPYYLFKKIKFLFKMMQPH